MGKGQRMILTYIAKNVYVLSYLTSLINFINYPMLYTKFQENRSIGSGEYF